VNDELVVGWVILKEGGVESPGAGCGAGAGTGAGSGLPDTDAGAAAEPPPQAESMAAAAKAAKRQKMRFFISVVRERKEEVKTCDHAIQQLAF
jgi:hypothetical protein